MFYFVASFQIEEAFGLSRVLLTGHTRAECLEVAAEYVENVLAASKGYGAYHILDNILRAHKAGLFVTVGCYDWVEPDGEWVGTFDRSWSDGGDDYFCARLADGTRLASCTHLGADANFQGVADKLRKAI
jgi:hypothetical protein